jgi:acyl carrier protein
MERQPFLEMIECILELRPGSLEGSERLAGFEQWDSIAILDYIAMIDRKFGVILNVDEIAACQSFDELCSKLNASLLQMTAKA